VGSRGMNVPVVKNIFTPTAGPASEVRGPVLLALIVLLLGLPWMRWFSPHEGEGPLPLRDRLRVELRCPEAFAGIYEVERGTTVGAFLKSVGKTQAERTIAKELLDRPLFDLCALVELSSGRWQVTSMPPATRFLLGEPLDLNRADSSALELLPNIGPVLAQRIVAYRDRHGPFHGPQELVRIRGISTTTLATLLPWVAVGPEEAAP
jgi:DNA uptake protein ComE-like DNA-binding protein